LGVGRFHGPKPNLGASSDSHKHIMKKERHIRSKNETQDDHEERDEGKAEAMDIASLKMLQKMRKRGTGVDAESLAAPGTSNQASHAADEAPEPPESSSVAMLRDSYVKATAVMSKEADEDEHMKRFVEIELSKRLGKKTTGPELDEGEKRRRKIDEDLYSIPEAFQPKAPVEIAEGGATMTGIAEVSVPMSERLKRIEETEAAKRRMLASAAARGGLGPSREDEVVAKPEPLKRREFPVSFGKSDPKKHKGREEVEYLRRQVIRD
jgi:hypothetical protein